MTTKPLKLSLGAIQFFWPKQHVLDFYVQMADLPLQTIYLGEAVCSRRQELRFADWLDLAKDLASTGKEIVFSSQVLLESESDLKRLRKLIEQEQFTLEANDLGAVKLAKDKGMAFVAGQTLNIYNQQTLSLMQSLGAYRWVAPVEMPQHLLKEISAASSELSCEVFGWGKLPLAFSSRCFTARHYNLKKDSCEFKCLEHPDALTLTTRENEDFLTINGIQTMSSACQCLLSHYQTLQEVGVNLLRLSPQQTHMSDIVLLHQAVIEGRLWVSDAIKQLRTYTHSPLIDGYWKAEAGIIPVKEISHASA